MKISFYFLEMVNVGHCTDPMLPYRLKSSMSRVLDRNGSWLFEHVVSAIQHSISLDNKGIKLQKKVYCGENSLCPFVVLSDIIYAPINYSKKRYSQKGSIYTHASYSGEYWWDLVAVVVVGEAVFCHPWNMNMKVWKWLESVWPDTCLTV